MFFKKKIDKKLDKKIKMIIGARGFGKIRSEFFWINRGYERGYLEGINETAQKFLQFVYDRVIDKHLIRDFEKFAKKFGVEIEE